VVPAPPGAAPSGPSGDVAHDDEQRDDGQGDEDVGEAERPVRLGHGGYRRRRLRLPPLRAGATDLMAAPQRRRTAAATWA
jgi:hypothetical protein